MSDERKFSSVQETILVVIKAVPYFIGDDGMPV